MESGSASGPLPGAAASALAPPVTRARQPLLLAAVVLGSMALRLPGLDGTLADHDTWRQTDTASIARNFLDEPDLLKPRINWGAPGPGYVESELQVFPFAVSLLYRGLGEDPLLGRLLALALAGLATVVFHGIARRFLDPVPALAAAAFFACSPLLFRYSRAFMPDAAALLFYLGALERFQAFLADPVPRWRPLLASAAALGVAVLVKPTSAHLGLVLLLLAVAAGRGRLLFSAKAAAFLLIVVVPVAAYYAHAASLHREFGNTFGVLSGGDSKFGGPRYWLDPGFYLRLARMDVRWIAGFPGVLLAVVGLVAVRRAGWRALALSWLGAVFLYYLVVARYAGVEARGLHYHLYAVAPVCLLAAGGAATLAARAGRFAGPVLAVLFVAVLATQTGRALDVLRMRSGTLLDAGLHLGTLSGPADTVVVLSHDTAVDQGTPNNFQEPDVLFHARRRGRILALDRQTGAALEDERARGARWFVNFPRLNAHAEASFRAALEASWERVATGPEYEIYRAR